MAIAKPTVSEDFADAKACHLENGATDAVGHKRKFQSLLNHFRLLIDC
jgi:hypothetical protein